MFTNYCSPPNAPTVISYTIAQSCVGEIIFTLSGGSVITTRSYQVEEGYNVKTTLNLTGDTVLAVQSPGQNSFETEPVITFGANTTTLFGVSHPSMDSEMITFGVTSEAASDTNIPGVTVTRYGIPGSKGAKVKLEIDSTYSSGQNIKMFLYKRIIQKEFDISLSTGSVFDDTFIISGSDIDTKLSNMGMNMSMEDDQRYKIGQRFKYKDTS